MKIRFLKSAVGSHQLGYLAGEVATLQADLAKVLIEQGIAEKVEGEKPKTRKAVSTKAKKAIKR